MELQGQGEGRIVIGRVDTCNLMQTVDCRRLTLTMLELLRMLLQRKRLDQEKGIPAAALSLAVTNMLCDLGASPPFPRPLAVRTVSVCRDAVTAGQKHL